MPAKNWGHLMIAALKQNAFDDPGASVAVHANALERICEQARDVAISSEVPDMLHRLLRRAISAGHGNDHYRVPHGTRSATAVESIRNTYQNVRTP
jgi:hypothetical protein